MKIVAELTGSQYTIKNNIKLFFIGISASIICVLLFFFGLSLEKSFIALVAVICLAFLFNFYSVYSLFIFSIFVPFQWVFHASVFFSIIVLISFTVNYPDVKIKDFSNPLKKSILIYLLSVIPSLYNSIEPLMSIVMFYNFAGMLVIMFVTMIAIDTNKKMMGVIYLYLAGVFVNSIYVIFLAASTGKRAWGFSGIFYVDFVGLATIISLILFIYSSGIKKIIFSLLLMVSLFGLLLTQTRNAWLSTAVSILLLFFFLIKNSKKYLISFKALVMIIITVATVVVIGYFGSSTFSTNLGDRLNQKSQTTELDDDPYSAGENSFVTRAFIWHTAVMAFIEHPIIGIGTYSFPFSSQNYYKIPKSFYEIFVRNRDPHITYLAVLTETGIVGFIGFMFFIVAIVKLVLNSLKLPVDKTDVIRTVIICFVFAYIIFSMAMTSSWIWGQQSMIMGIFLGMLIGNNNMLTKKSKYANALG